MICEHCEGYGEDLDGDWCYHCDGTGEAEYDEQDDEYYD